MTKKSTIKEAIKEMMVEWIGGNVAEKVATQITNLFKERLEGVKIKPHSYQIPCPEGKQGCLVIHWSKDLILTPRERDFNQKIDDLLKEL